MSMTIPPVYEAGYERARKLNPELAARYIAYTTQTDPAADAVIESLASCDHGQLHEFIKAGMDRDEEILDRAPARLREFFDDIEPVPEWFDPAVVVPGCTAFHRYSDLFIPAFFVSTLQNASTLIAKAFHASGRVMSGSGPRRIRQNTRHFIEIMLPGAMERHGDGWKLSVRIRLVHAQLRRLIRVEGNWDESVFGVPLSQAHMALASANFSATMLQHARSLGAVMDDEVRNGFMQIWRYASWLIGTPPELLFEGDEPKTNELSRIAHLCEPPPGEESRVIASALIQALPIIAGKTAADDARTMVEHAYRVSRALLGHELADKLAFPSQTTAGLLPWMRLQRRAHGLSHTLAPRVADKWRGNNLAFLLEASMLDDLSYRIPDHLKTEHTTPW